MHILHTVFTNDLGGTERYVADLANAQISDGHQVSVMIRGNRQTRSEDAFLNWLDAKVKLITLPSSWLFLRWPLLPIWNHLRQLKPDVIHTHHGRDSRYLAKLAGRIPVVGSLHMGYRHKDYQRHNGLICVSNWQLATIPLEQNAPRAVIPNWVKEIEGDGEVNHKELRASLHLTDETILFGSVGRLSAEKGADLLIEAFKQADIHNSHLTIFGTGEEKVSLEALIGAATNISLMGYEENIRPWYAIFDVFVLPSRKESFGLVLLEAMDAGCRIIATRTDGAVDLLGDNKEVFMVDVDALQQLASALVTAANMPRQSIEYSELEAHRLPQASAAIMEFYERLRA
ncbi:MAG: glycosyltransferase [Rickettsiales bacterium]|nr:glycosyltransferase [Rickettsiales bacterium]